MAKLHRTMLDLEKWAKPHGWKWDMSNGGHVKWVHPKIKMPVFTAATPSCARAIKNNISIMKRAMAQQGISIN